MMTAMMTSTQYLERAARDEVNADRAEEAGNANEARAFARGAGEGYERAAGLLEGVSLERAITTYRAAQRCYSRGGSVGRAFRMGVRAERYETERLVRLNADCRWFEILPEVTS